MFMGRFDSFIALRDFLSGKINQYQLADVDPKIGVRLKSNLGESMLYYDFGDEDELFKIIGVSEEDIHSYNSLSSNYGNVYYGEEMGHEDFNNGYGLWDDIDDENMDKLKMISQFIMKEPFDLGDNDFLGRFAEELYKIFPKETRSFIVDYSWERDNAMKSEAEEIIRNDIKEFFQNIGLQNAGGGEVAIKVQKLFDKYLELGSPHYSMKKVFSEIFKESNENLGGWNDTIWESDWEGQFDRESFNNLMGKELDSIIEKLEDDENKARNFVEMIRKITSKHPQGYWKFLPKDKNKKVEYRVKGFDYPTQRIIVQLRKELKMKEFKMTEENFNNLLYQPELFNIGELHDF